VCSSDLEAPPLTIADLEAYSEKLTISDGPRVTQYGFIPWFSQGWLYTWGWAFGGQFQDAETGRITASDPLIVEALQWEADFAKKYGYENMDSFASAAGGENLNPFSAGMLSMMVSGPWEIASLKANAPDIDFGVSYIPTPTGDNFNSWAGGWSHVIPIGVVNIEEAVQFAAFMSVGQGAFNYGEDTAHFMCAMELNDTFSWVQEEPRFSKFIEVFPASYCRPVISQGMLLWDELANATNLALIGEGEPADLLLKVEEKVNAALGF
jgi:multiple sugar transport system substrate-binding protein